MTGTKNKSSAKSNRCQKDNNALYTLGEPHHALLFNWTKMGHFSHLRFYHFSAQFLSQGPELGSPYELYEGIQCQFLDFHCWQYIWHQNIQPRISEDASQA